MNAPAIRTLSLAAVTLAFTVAGCGAPRTGPVRDVTAKAAELLARAPDRYGPDAAMIPESPADARVRATFEGAIPAAARGAIKHEPALDLVARVAADMLSAEKQPPAHALVEWLFWRAGATSRYARMETMVAEGVDDLDLQTADAAGRLQAPVYPESFGLARSSRGRAAQVIVFGRRPIEIDPLPKTYAPGAPVTIKARALDAFSELVLLSDEEGGGVASAPFTAAAGGVFTVTTKAPGKPGRYFLEITGLDARTASSTPENPWRRTLFHAPIFVGVPEAKAPDDFVASPPPPVFDATSWSGKIVDAYNAARGKAGKPFMVTDGRLSALAVERGGVVARAQREPPPDVVLADKLAATGFPPHDYDAVEARIDAPKDYVAQRLLLPSVRRRVMSAEALVIGLGLAPRAPGLSGRVENSLVEYVVEPVARLDRATARPKVQAALDAQAAAEGRAAYKHDEDVSKVVQRFADDVCAGNVRPNQMKLLVDKARGVGEKYKRWSTPVWRAGYDYTRWQDASVLSRSKEQPLAYADVGLCQGNLPGKPGGSYVVVIQYAP